MKSILCGITIGFAAVGLLVFLGFPFNVPTETNIQPIDKSTQVFPVVLVESKDADGRYFRRLIRWRQSAAPPLGSKWQVAEDSGSLVLVAPDAAIANPIYTIVGVYSCNKLYGRSDQ